MLTIYLISLLSLLLAGPVVSLRNSKRSLMQCDQVDSHGWPFDGQEACDKHCELVYASSEKDSISGLKLKHHEFRESKSTCCCFFEYPWYDVVQLASSGLRPMVGYAGSALDCLPLTFSVRLSKRTKLSYDLVCSYLQRSTPLTILEMIDFVQAAAYLDLQKPKHPFIMKTASLKEMKTINKEALKEVRSKEFQELFLDEPEHYVERYNGILTDNYKIKRMQAMRKESLRAASRSPIVAKALDEYMISYAMVDMASAAYYIDEIHARLRVSSRLLAGNYDRYNIDGNEAYFYQRDLDCNLIRETSGQLNGYLFSMSSIMNNLYEKLVYDHMAKKYDHLKFLIHSANIYKELIKVNCQKKMRENK